MNKHKLRLLGGTPNELRISAKVLHEAVGALIEGARMATRFAVEGESVRKGPRPTWLDTACDFVVTELSAGSAVISMEAYTLKEIDERRFGLGAQQSLFGDVNERFGEQTAIDIFGQVLASVLAGEPDEIVADRPLLDICARFASVSGSNYHGLQLEGLSGRASSLMVSPSDVPQIELLRDETPCPQAARVTGILDTVSASRTDLVLRLKDGTCVPGRMEEHDLEVLRPLLGKEVVVSGMAHFRPSGRLLLMDIEAIDAAGTTDRIFQKPPVARKRRIVVEPVQAQVAEGVSTFFGIWPGVETDTELLAALKEIPLDCRMH